MNTTATGSIDAYAIEAQTAIAHAEKRRECAVEMIQAKQKCLDLERGIKMREAEIKAEIASELGEDGKPRYSNEIKRDAEFIARSNAILYKLRADLDRENHYAAACGIDAEYHRDMVRILCAFAQAGNEVL